MKQKYLKANKKATHLICYFTGWGTPATVINHLLLPEQYDLLICYDYRDLTFAFDFSPYQQINVVAWSMGVWVADQVMHNIPIHHAVAINGTGLPCHDQYGIPETIFMGTLNNLNSANRQKFERRMCNDKTQFEHYQQLGEHRSLNEIHQELNALYYAIQQPNQTVIAWQKAIIGTQDKIFPKDNQLAYWQSRSQIQQIEMGHYPFSAFTHWEQLWR